VTPTGRDEAAVIRAAASTLGLALDDAALGRMLRFSATLALWNRRLRLTGDPDPSGWPSSTFADSLAVTAVLPDSGPVIDIGSGQGFPGIILGCVRPELELVLIESRRRRASFPPRGGAPDSASSRQVLEARAEAVGQPLASRGQMIVARALRLDLLLALARPLLAPDGRVIAMQMERGVPGARAVAARSRFRVCEERRYALPDGARRALLVLAAEV
jgi:16S rRNA (guanine527-N7)-methyltransferase